MQRIPSSHCGPQAREGSIERDLNYTHFDADIEHRFFDEAIEYPLNFPNLKLRAGDIPLNELLFKSLLPFGQVFGDIIEAFFKAVEDVACSNGLKLLSFSTFAVTSILRTNISSGFNNWFMDKNPKTFDLWLLPVHVFTNHWTLLLDPPKNFTTKIERFLDSVGISNPPNCPLQSWKLFIPRDVPRQQITRMKNDMNCGIHVCMSGYMVASGSGLLLRADRMDIARRGIAKFIMEYKYNEAQKENKKAQKGNRAARKVQSNDTLSRNHIDVYYQPPAESTVDFCKSLKTLIYENK